jgi:hypothetical protein
MDDMALMPILAVTEGAIPILHRVVMRRPAMELPVDKDMADRTLPHPLPPEVLMEDLALIW